MRTMKSIVSVISVIGCAMSSVGFARANQEEDAAMEVCMDYCSTMTTVTHQFPEASQAIIDTHNSRSFSDNLLLKRISVTLGLLQEMHQVSQNVMGALIAYAHSASISDADRSKLNQAYSYAASGLRVSLSMANEWLEVLRTTNKSPFRVPGLNQLSLNVEDVEGLMTEEGRIKANGYFASDNPQGFLTALRCAYSGLVYMRASIEGAPTDPLILDDYCWDQIRPLNEPANQNAAAAEELPSSHVEL
ncbi:MAG: hypothetical protein J0G29_01660 [Alphaproteobacteria bacterium]|nr:hypothetical protein [Alphaproteobacteria bacterium]OJV45446.1 MAG: hypothetical protein BGO28_04950 [Alphaproteobacteria bacterium 43-37]